MTMSSDPNPLDLGVRTGWPPELRYLLERFPRGGWPDHPNLGDLTQFWLEIHESFRAAAVDLERRADDVREGRTVPEQYWAGAAPRMRRLLAGLGYHHRVEDSHVFPVLMEAEARLIRGFEVLERDHDALHARIDRLVALSRVMPVSLTSDTGDIARSVDDLTAAQAHLAAGLRQHLADEEDLIVPLILDRTEVVLGM